MNSSDLAASPQPISRWACHKLECLSDYFLACAPDFKKTPCYYIGLHTGAATFGCKGTDCHIAGPMLRALKAAFAGHILVGQDAPAPSYYVADRPVLVASNLTGDRSARQVFDLVPRSAASFAFIDLPGYTHLRWSVIQALAAHGLDWRGHKTELLIAFPVEMAVLRSLTRPECETSITRLYGHRGWLEVKQARLNGIIGLGESRKRLTKLFVAGLKELDYRHVSSFEPQFEAPAYYCMIAASDFASRAQALTEAWGRQRYLPCELLYKQDQS